MQQRAPVLREALDGESPASDHPGRSAHPPRLIPAAEEQAHALDQAVGVRADVPGDSVVDDVAWSYNEPLPETEPITGYFAFDTGRADVVAELPG